MDNPRLDSTLVIEVHFTVYLIGYSGSPWVQSYYEALLTGNLPLRRKQRLCSLHEQQTGSAK